MHPCIPALDASFNTNQNGCWSEVLVFFRFIAQLLMVYDASLSQNSFKINIVDIYTIQGIKVSQ